MSTESIDQMAQRIKMRLVTEAQDRGEEGRAQVWHGQWCAECDEDKRLHGQVQ